MSDKTVDVPDGMVLVSRSDLTEVMLLARFSLAMLHADCVDERAAFFRVADALSSTKEKQ
jgi:hypothetical protein